MEDRCIGYSEFVSLWGIEDPKNLDYGFVLKPDGVYVDVPEDWLFLTPEERSAVTEHPKKDLTKPILSFPCSVRELLEFEELQCGGAFHIDTVDLKKYCNSPLDSRLHVSKSQLQEDLILKCLKGLSYDPQKLPKPDPGKGGPKLEIWTQLKDNKSCFTSKKVFDTAWQRLRAAGQVQDKV